MLTHTQEWPQEGVDPHARVHGCTHIHTHTHVCISTSFTCTLKHIHTLYIHILLHSCAHIPTHNHTLMCLCTLAQVCGCYTHIHTHTSTYTHTHPQVHTYTTRKRSIANMDINGAPHTGAPLMSILLMAHLVCGAPLLSLSWPHTLSYTYQWRTMESGPLLVLSSNGTPHPRCATTNIFSVFFQNY